MSALPFDSATYAVELEAKANRLRELLARRKLLIQTLIEEKPDVFIGIDVDDFKIKSRYVFVPHLAWKLLSLRYA